jgi:hypothetical protein
MDLNIVVIESNGNLKKTLFKKFNEETLYKKCNLKKPDDFEEKTKWTVTIDGEKYNIFLYAKEKGRANNENKYDFPPPVDNSLFFGNCVLFAKDSDNDYIDLSIELWNKIYEKLFGGFENLDASAENDDDEEDELDNVPQEMKTKEGGYLKDDFVVDDDDDPDEEADVDDDDDGEEEESWDDNNESLENDDDEEDDEMFDELGSELSVECYDYSDED